MLLSVIFLKIASNGSLEGYNGLQTASEVKPDLKFYLCDLNNR